MAQVDTGLGWSAESDWLLQGTNIIGSTINEGEIIAKDTWGFRSAYTLTPGGATQLLSVQVGIGDSDVYIIGALGSGGNGTWFFYSRQYFDIAYFCDRGTPPPAAAFRGYSSILDAQTGLYYYFYNGAFVSSTMAPLSGYTLPGVITVEASFGELNTFVRAVLDALAGNAALSKKNSGYAIACWVNWRDTASTILTPVLISTVEEYTKFTVDSTTEYPYSYTSIQRYEGLTFYMAYIRRNDISFVPQQWMHIIDLSSVLVSIDELFRGIVGPSFANVTVTAPPEPYDPYAPGGNSETGGGEGSFDDTSDVIDISPVPTLSFASTGFTRIYNPTLQEINALANYLWTDTTFLDTVINHLKQLLENPMDAIISLSLLPCTIPNGSPESVKVMYVNTGVTMAPATTQFVDVDCGTFALEEYYGSALDYNPYTKVHCYLPYIGQVTLDADEVMGKTLQVKYRIDIVTGMCAVLILVDQSVMYQFSGHCAISMPINSADFSGYIAAAMTAGKMVAGVVAGATGNIPLAAELIGAPAPQSTTSERVKKETERNPQTGRQVTARTTTTTYNRTSTGASFGEMSRKAAANTVGAIMGSKVTVEHAGGFTGNSGYLAVRRPYLIIERPRMCNPEEYGKYNGRPSMIYMSLGQCVGYTEVQSIQFNGISATNPEMAELSELLKSGVIF